MMPTAVRVITAGYLRSFGEQRNSVPDDGTRWVA